MPKTILTMVTWNRLEITKHTLATFHKFNGHKIEILVVDNGSTDGTVEWLQKQGYEVVQNRKNMGIFLATRSAWLECFKRGYSFIINVQNDFPSVRTIPINELEKFLDNRQDVGFVQLNDKSKMVYVRSDGTKKTRKKPRTVNVLTKKRLKYLAWEKLTDDNSVCTGNHHFTFNPTIFRVSLVSCLVGETHKPRERYIMEQFEQTGLLSAKLKRKCFETIIRTRESGWIH